MIKDDVLVFDCVPTVQLRTLRTSSETPASCFRQHLFAFHNVLTPRPSPAPAEESSRSGGTLEISRMVFDESDTDMLVAMPAGSRDLFFRWALAVGACVELRDENPDHDGLLGRSPAGGRKALEEMEVQVNEYGAKAFKFYNVRYDYGEPFPWRMDDPKIAFPIYEKAQELGID